jgi:hypothetical protein
VDIEQLLGAMWHLANGKDALLEGREYDCRSKDDLKDVLVLSFNVKPLSDNQAMLLEQYQAILKPLSECGTRFISNQFEHYFIVQCDVDFDKLEDAMEFESLEDMLESMAIVHEAEQDRLENTAVIIRRVNDQIVACDIKGCWRPYPSKIEQDLVETVINEFQL